MINHTHFYDLHSTILVKKNSNSRFMNILLRLPCVHGKLLSQNSFLIVNLNFTM